MGYELARVAERKIERHPEEKEGILSLLSLALNLNINWVEVDHGESVRLALEKGLTAYDASYLHVSNALGIPLLTFDEELRRSLV